MLLIILFALFYFTQLPFLDQEENGSIPQAVGRYPGEACPEYFPRNIKTSSMTALAAFYGHMDGFVY